MSLHAERIEVRFFLPLYDIGLAPGAIVSLNITNSRPSNQTFLVILSHTQWAAWVELSRTGLPGSGYRYLISHWRQPFSATLSISHTICAAKPDRYYLMLLNLQQEVMVIEGNISYVNPGEQHLPLQLVHLPQMLWISSIAFMGLLVVVVLLAYSVWHREATLLHALLATCLWLKAAELCLKWKYFSILKVKGQAPGLLLQTWQLTSKLHEVIEISLLLITALGWRVLRPRLTATEVRFTALLAATLVTLQVCSEADSSKPVVSFKQLFDMVRWMCYMVILIATNFNLRLIDLHLAESPVTEYIAKLYRKQQAYLGFRRVFVAMMLRPLMLVWLQLWVLDDEGTQWAVDALGEASMWLLYLGLGVALRPGASYFGLVRDVVSAATVARLEPSSPAPRPQQSRWGATPPPRLQQVTAEVGARVPGVDQTSDSQVPYVQLASG